MAIIGLLAVAARMAVKNEYFTHEEIYKGIHYDENFGDHIFVISATCSFVVSF